MKQRITYIVRNSRADYNPENIQIEKKALTISNLAGAKEQHITFGLHELPAGVRCSIFHIRV